MGSDKKISVAFVCLGNMYVSIAENGKNNSSLTNIQLPFADG